MLKSPMMMTSFAAAKKERKELKSSRKMKYGLESANDKGGW